MDYFIKSKKFSPCGRDFEIIVKCFNQPFYTIIVQVDGNIIFVSETTTKPSQFDIDRLCELTAKCYTVGVLNLIKNKVTNAPFKTPIEPIERQCINCYYSVILGTNEVYCILKDTFKNENAHCENWKTK